MRKQTTSQKIIEAADALFYEQGFEATSFAHIAQSLGISRGNFYYHFSTKDDILNAVINHRLSKTEGMLNDWELQGETPGDRIRSFIGILIKNRSKILQYGCPVGTLTSELIKLSHPAKLQANALFSLFLVWLQRQFELLGRKDADKLAMHLLALSQGVATIANAFDDSAFIDDEVARLNVWLKQYES